MSAETNDWKLGLFVSLSAAVIFVSIAFLGTQSLDETFFVFETYFDESVQGMEKGSPVKFRGAPVGTINEIGVAPDQKHVRVVFDLKASRMLELGFKATSPEVIAAIKQGGRIPGIYKRWPKELRVQLVSAGITGMKFLQIDVFEDEPIPTYTFDLPENYCPAAPSMMKSLEDSVMTTLHKAPEIADRLDETLKRVNQKLDELDVAKLSKTVQDLLDNGNKQLKELEVNKLNDAAKTAMEELTATLKDARATIARLNKEEGAIENLESVAKNLDAQIAKLDLEAAVKNLEGTARAAKETAEAVTILAEDGQLQQTLLSVEQAARSLRQLADALERDSDMLLKGRSARD